MNLDELEEDLRFFNCWNAGKLAEFPANEIRRITIAMPSLIAAVRDGQAGNWEKLQAANRENEMLRQRFEAMAAAEQTSRNEANRLRLALTTVTKRLEEILKAPAFSRPPYTDPNFGKGASEP